MDKGTASLIASGVASRFALYSGKISWRSVGSGRSKQTAICVGFSLLNKSSKALVNPYTAEVSNPLEVILGFLANANMRGKLTRMHPVKTVFCRK